MSKLIVSTDPAMNGGIAKINSFLLNNFAFKEYLIISNKKPDREINSTTWLKSYGKAPIIFFNLFKLIKIISKFKNRSSIILCDPQFSSISYIILFINIFLKNKIFFISHGFLFHDQKNLYIKKLYFKIVTKFFLKHFNLISISPNDSKILRSFKFFKFTEIFNGVEKIKFSKIKKYKFCLVGRNVSSKKIKNYIDFLKHFNDLHPNSGLRKSVLITDNLDQIDISKTKNLNIYFKLKKSDYEKILSQSNYILSFSEYEGFGLSVLEGLSARLIPICRKNPSFSAIFKDCKELLFDKYSYQKVIKIYDKIENLNNKNKKKLKKKLMDIYFNYSSEKMIKKYKIVIN